MADTSSNLPTERIKQSAGWMKTVCSRQVTHLPSLMYMLLK